VTSSKYLEGLGGRGDFPVHNKPCLWMEVEKLEVISKWQSFKLALEDGHRPAYGSM
jgi:hypothetical protein